MSLVAWMRLSLMAWGWLFMVFWIVLFLVSLFRRGSCRMRIAGLARRRRAGHRPGMVWPGCGGGDTCQGKRTATEDDGHRQTLAWAGGWRMCARVARHQQVCA